MIFSWLHLAIVVMLLASIAFAAGPLAASMLLAPRARGGSLTEPYECGMPTHGATWIRFGLNYYFYALLFLAFDVDVLYLFPVAVAYRDAAGWLPLVEIVLFVAILGLAIVYFWKKGVFSWPRKIKV